VERFQIDGYTVDAIEVWHHQMQVLGFRFGKLAYITDAKTIHALEKAKLQDLDILIINALHLYPHPSHFNLAEALEFIAEIKPKQSYLTHISHLFGLHEQINETLPANVQLAYDGLVLHFNYSA
jgi:phosphoribosyl 1,2-cyclic phosphate phosphodiesterase